MNADVKKKWIKALLSGDYKQARGSLQNRDGFCCLGVLCDISKKGTWARDPGSTTRREERYTCASSESTTVLPRDVIEWADLPNSNPNAGIADAQGRDLITTFNDEGSTFEELAEIIDNKF